MRKLNGGGCSQGVKPGIIFLKGGGLGGSKGLGWGYKGHRSTADEAVSPQKA